MSMFAGEGDSPPPFMNDPSEKKAEEPKKESEPQPSVNPSGPLLKDAGFTDLINAAMAKARHERVKILIERGRSAYLELKEKIGEKEATQAISKLYIEAVEGKLNAAKDAQRQPE